VVDWALPDASLWITWSGISDDFDFTLQLVAVDAAGNESAPQTVRIQDDSGGCSIGHRNAIGDAAPVIAMFALAVAARRRRAKLSKIDLQA
jgi:hypothetical protein